MIATVGSDGKVDFYNRSKGTVQLIADLAGYYAPGSSNTLVVPSDGTGQENGQALVNAITAVNNAGAVTPTTIQLEPGTYTLSNQTAIPSNTWIVGAGQGLTTIQATSTSGYGLYFSGSNNALENLNVAASSPNGIFAGGGTLEIDNSTIAFTGDQFAITSQETNLTLNNTTITSTASTSGGLAVDGGTALVVGGLITTDGFATLLSASPGLISVRGSDISNDKTGGDSIDVSSGTIHIASTQVGTGSIVDSGTLVCVNDYSDTLTALNSVCI